MNNLPLFVLTTSEGCGACVNFKTNTWPSLKKKLLQDNRINVLEINVSNTSNKPDPNKYHKDIGRFVGWYPTMALFPHDRWNDKESDLIGIVKDGKLVPPSVDKNGKTVPEHIEPMAINLSERNILGWVNHTLTKDPIFTSRYNNTNNTNNTNNNFNNILLTKDGKC